MRPADRLAYRAPRNLTVQSVAVKASSLGHADVIGVFVGIVGIVLAWVFYLRSKEQVRPCILIERTTLLGRSERLIPESVEIRYNNRAIPELSKARITFWNAGKKTLNESDIAHSDPITIRFPESEVQVLDIRSMITTRDVINADASLKDNVIYLSFDFLDKGDGLALEAFYDSGWKTKVTFSGTIKGIRGGIAVRTSENFLIPAPSDAPGTGFRLLGVGALAIPALIVTSIIFQNWRVNVSDITLSTVFSFLGASLFSYGAYRYFRSRMPRALRRDFEAVESPNVDKQS